MDAIDVELNQLVNRRREIYHLQTQHSLERQKLTHQLSSMGASSVDRKGLERQLEGLTAEVAELRVDQSRIFDQLQSLLSKRASLAAAQGLDIEKGSPMDVEKESPIASSVSTGKALLVQAAEANQQPVRLVRDTKVIYTTQTPPASPNAAKTFLKN